MDELERLTAINKLLRGFIAANSDTNLAGKGLIYQALALSGSDWKEAEGSLPNNLNYASRILEAKNPSQYATRHTTQ